MASETDSYATDSVASSPRSDADHARVRFMCSFGGKIVPRPHDNQLRYVGGDTRIVGVHRSASYASLLSKLSKFTGTSNVAVKYQLPSEDLDALISVTTDEDVENMIDEYDRVALNQNPRATRLRLFLFPKDDDFSSAAANRDNWFIDALNSGGGGGGGGVALERNRSEVSYIVSEVPDYLFGLDNSDEAHPKPKPRPVLHDAVSVPDPVVTPQFSSIPNLPPVKTKPEAAESSSDPAGIMQPNPVLHYVPGPNYPGQAVHHPVPVYYVPGHGHVTSVPVQHVPVQVPVGYAYAGGPAGRVAEGGGAPRGVGDGGGVVRGGPPGARTRRQAI